jgi:hypothetical protein
MRERAQARLPSAGLGDEAARAILSVHDVFERSA